MSAYMVDEKTMSEIASRIEHEIKDQHNGWMEYHIPRLFAVVKAENTADRQSQIGLLLRIENEKALSARYGDKFSEEDRPIIRSGLYYMATLQRSIENLQEYIYQISEGDCEDNLIYHEIKKMEYFLLKDFFRAKTGK